jgi:hypothetical protein
MFNKKRQTIRKQNNEEFTTSRRILICVGSVLSIDEKIRVKKSELQAS